MCTKDKRSEKINIEHEEIMQQDGKSRENKANKHSICSE